MKSRIRRRLHAVACDRSGSTLLMVVILAGIAVALLAAITVTALSANSVSANNVKAQQAYFTARSAVNSLASYIVNPDNANKLDAIVPKNPGDPAIVSAGDTASGLGYYKLTVTKVTATKIKISAIARYPNRNGAAGTVTRYVNASGGQGNNSQFSPFSGIFYLNTKNPVSLGQCGVFGDVITNGGFTYAQGSSITGSILANGDVSISGGASGTLNKVYAIGNLSITQGGTITSGDVEATGDVLFSGSGTVNGSLFTNGTLTMSNGLISQNATCAGDAVFSGGGTVNGNLFINGALSMPNGKVGGNATCGGNATFSGGGTVNGNLLSNGSLTMNGGKIGHSAACVGNAAFGWGSSIVNDLTAGGTFSYPQSSSISTFVGGTASMGQNVNKAGKVNNIAIAAPTVVNKIIAPPSQQSNPTLYAPAALTNQSGDQYNGCSSATIKSDGTLNMDYGSSNINGVKFAYGSTVTIDTDAAGHDISLLVTKDTSVLNGMSINVTGSHNVYIYLTNGASLSLPGNNYLGMSDPSLAPRVFIIGGQGSSVSTKSSSSLNACIYIPTGTFTATDSVYKYPWKFKGSVVANNISVDHLSVSNSLQFIKSDLSGTPLSGLFSSGWSLGEWSAN